jgi:hypothetical protein
MMMRQLSREKERERVGVAESTFLSFFLPWKGKMMREEREGKKAKHFLFLRLGA